MSRLRAALRPLAVGLVIGLLTAVALVPLIRSDTPCSHDGGLHYFRVVAMRHALNKGILFSRWLPDLAFGYGFPFFNYRAAISYYLALAPHVAGLALPVALNLVYVLSFLGCAAGAYLLARDLFGPRAGMVAAVAYAYAPYQFLDALERANAPESLALALLPWILWAFRRLALTGRRRWFLASAASLALLYCTHNISSLLFTPLLLGFLAVLWLIHRRDGHWVLTAAALILALGVTAFFWAPALLEREYVQLHMSRNNRNNDFHYNFLTLAEILSPPTPVDTSLMNPPMRIHLGLTQAVLAGLGMAVGLLRWRDRRRRAWVIFLALAAAVLVGMSTRASLWLWEHVPLLPFVQFPWRLIGRAALPVALLASVPFAAPPALPRRRRWLHLPTSALAIGLLILSAMPYTFPPHGYCPKAPHPTVEDLFAYEHRSGMVGVDPTGSYFPAWVARRPTGSPLEERYGGAEPVARFDPTTLPAGGSVVEADYGPNRARLVIETPEPFRARYLAFYFPGWQVRVDGEPVETAATTPDGLIAFHVPAGRHAVTVRFGETALRLAADAASILSLAALVVVAIRLHGGRAGSSLAPGRPLRRAELAWLAALGLLLLGFKVGVVDRVETPFRRPSLRPDGSLPAVQQPLDQAYADGLTLIGCECDPARLPADGVLRCDLYWRAHAQPSASYQTVIHLVGPDGLRWSLADTFRPRGYAKARPTTTWRAGEYALDSHEIEPLAGAPPGDYEIVLTVFDRDTLAPLATLNEQGQPAEPRLSLGQVTLTRPGQPAELEALGMRSELDLALGPVTLLGADFDRDEAAPGDSVLLVTFWRADRAPAQDLALRVELGRDGARAAAYEIPPTAAWHPTSAWRAGDLWRGQRILRLPATLASGDYTWALGLAEGDLHPAGRLSVDAPAHTYTPPPVDVAVGTRLGDVATLVGAAVEPADPVRAGTPLTVTLVWRAEETPARSYRVFVHLLDGGGGLVAQSDGVPAGWTRPTTGWLPGEYVVDAHVLTPPADAPAGAYALSAGLYLHGGARLTTPQGRDAVPVTQIEITSAP